MVFSSITFLFYYLPVMLLVYYIAPKAWKNGILFLGSLIFYAWGEPVYVGIMIFSSLLDYCCGRGVEKFRGRAGAKIFLLISICVNLGMLGFFKYSGMAARFLDRLTGLSISVPSLALPIGISFYTFQTMSYTIDVYRGKFDAQKNFISFGAYVSLFPQLIAGPIVRYETIAAELENRVCTPEKFAYGIRRFICGLMKKVLLANNIGMLWETVSESCLNGQGSVLMGWFGLIAYGFQIYYDFSGYSDMAIGLGSMFGFTFPENFDHPFCADSITDFWRRWHMTLGGWFRDYVYIPLGGSRKGKMRQMCNLFIVWFLTGLWHGASWNFVSWGLYFGVLLVFEKVFLLKVLQRLPAMIGHIYAVAAITFSWVLFAFTATDKRMQFLSILTGTGGVSFIDQETLYLLTSYAGIMILCILFTGPWMGKLCRWLQKKVASWVYSLVEIPLIFAGLGLCVTYLISSTYNPFLYFRF